MENKTWLQPEEFAYPSGGQTRKGVAYFVDKKYRRVWAGIPDTYFSIPAHAKVTGKYVAGFLTSHEGEWQFNEYTKYSHILGEVA